MIHLKEYVKYGTTRDILDGWIYWIPLGQEYGNVLVYKDIVVYIELYITNLDSVVWVMY